PTPTMGTCALTSPISTRACAHPHTNTTLTPSSPHPAHTHTHSPCDITHLPMLEGLQPLAAPHWVVLISVGAAAVGGYIPGPGGAVGGDGLEKHVVGLCWHSCSQRGSSAGLGDGPGDGFALSPGWVELAVGMVLLGAGGWTGDLQGMELPWNNLLAAGRFLSWGKGFVFLQQALSNQLEPGQAPLVLEEKLESKEEQTPTGQGDGVKNTHAATSKPVARAKRGTSKCPECGKIFRWSNSMRRHQRNHTGERPYKCPDCGKTFKDFSSLISLHRIHKGERPYKCLQCGECFSHSSSLSTHRRTHTGEKPSSCSDCGESFTQDGDLQHHQMTHSKEKPFPCTMCGRSFSNGKTLIRHQQTHTGERPYPCSHCGKKFRRRSHLTGHQKRGLGSQEDLNHHSLFWCPM
uniref:C2H2-type domain-containing protein n=1 Tax=Bubo bubo TaxID=30461 RepID=A0A8C0FSW8_BUBBB